ncbi:hypothetical protein VP01_96g5 [Puccinia sorghi]|uniref:Uncharacterized protein n=1 Tax=Puccinia sorghi TaxID=27349 RepID=A0A0L6U5Y9_9BASI|nr:hypothetical protein VP01_96g5 [Puccinia sorghi]
MVNGNLAATCLLKTSASTDSKITMQPQKTQIQFPTSMCNSPKKSSVECAFIFINWMPPFGVALTNNSVTLIPATKNYLSRRRSIEARKMLEILNIILDHQIFHQMWSLHLVVFLFLSQSSPGSHGFCPGRKPRKKLMTGFNWSICTSKTTGCLRRYSCNKKSCRLRISFCNQVLLFCHAEQSQIPALKLSRRREKAETISSARNSQDAESHNEQKKLLIETGVRWSELNRLAYWDPSRHVVLGVMHNWIKGRTRLTVQSTIVFEPEDLSDYVSTDENEDDDILLNAGFGGSFFTKDNIDQFRTLLRQVVLPPGVPHLPLNLGEAAHGNLSASQWHALFVFIVPLVICEIAPMLFLHENSSKVTSKDLKLTTKNIQIQSASYLKASKYIRIITLPFTFLNKCLIGVWLVSRNILGSASLDSYRK